MIEGRIFGVGEYRLGSHHKSPHKRPHLSPQDGEQTEDALARGQPAAVFETNSTCSVSLTKDRQNLFARLSAIPVQSQLTNFGSKYENTNGVALLDALFISIATGLESEGSVHTQTRSGFSRAQEKSKAPLNNSSQRLNAPCCQLDTTQTSDIRLQCRSQNVLTLLCALRSPSTGKANKQVFLSPTWCILPDLPKNIQ